jgi:hypothetical protein
VVSDRVAKFETFFSPNYSFICSAFSISHAISFPNVQSNDETDNGPNRHHEQTFGSSISSSKPQSDSLPHIFSNF